MRSFVVTALAVAIVSCLALTVSAGSYGGQGHHAAYAQFQRPRYGVRLFQQRFLLNPGSGSFNSFAGGSQLYSRPILPGGGGIIGSTIGTGFSLIWLLVIAAVLLFLIGSL